MASTVSPKLSALIYPVSTRPSFSYTHAPHGRIPFFTEDMTIFAQQVPCTCPTTLARINNLFHQRLAPYPRSVDIEAFVDLPPAPGLRAGRTAEARATDDRGASPVRAISMQPTEGRSSIDPDRDDDESLEVKERWKSWNRWTYRVRSGGEREGTRGKTDEREQRIRTPWRTIERGGEQFR